MKNIWLVNWLYVHFIFLPWKHSQVSTCTTQFLRSEWNISYTFSVSQLYNFVCNSIFLCTYLFIWGKNSRYNHGLTLGKIIELCRVHTKIVSGKLICIRFLFGYIYCSNLFISVCRSKKFFVVKDRHSIILCNTVLNTFGLRRWSCFCNKWYHIWYLCIQDYFVCASICSTSSSRHKTVPGSAQGKAGLCQNWCTV